MADPVVHSVRSWLGIQSVTSSYLAAPPPRRGDGDGDRDLMQQQPTGDPRRQARSAIPPTAATIVAVLPRSTWPAVCPLSPSSIPWVAASETTSLAVLVILQMLPLAIWMSARPANAPVVRAGPDAFRSQMGILLRRLPPQGT